MVEKKDIVLFVDDELPILNAIRRAIMDEPFTALFANSGKDALEMFIQHDISVIVTDMRMPGMDGLTLLKHVREISPKTTRVVLSGYTQLSQVLAAVNHGEIFQFISKPWEMEEDLLMVVRRAIERRNMEDERESLRNGLVRKNNAYMNILREMEQKLANEKKDIISIKNISLWLFAFWKRHFEETVACAVDKQAENIRDIELIEKIQMAFISALPSVFDSRPIAQVIEDLENSCAGQVEIKGDRSISALYWGYYGVLVMVFKILIYLHNSSPDQAVTAEFSVQETEEKEGLQLVFTSDPSPEAKTDRQRLQLGYALLNEIVKHYNMKILPKTIDSEVESVHIICQVSLNSSQQPGAIRKN